MRFSLLGTLLVNDTWRIKFKLLSTNKLFKHAALNLNGKEKKTPALSQQENFKHNENTT